MKAEIISIGTELLLGELVDTNSPHIARELPALGIDVYHISISGDNPGRLTGTIRRAYDRSDLVATDPAASPIALSRGLDTMLLVAAVHRSSETGRRVRIDHAKGWTPTALIVD